MPPLGEVFPLVLGLLLLGVLFGVRLASWNRQRRGRAVARRGAQGEVDGVRLLEEAGFEVLETQVRAKAFIEIDGVTESFDLWLDATARKNGQLYLAEFKTGGATTVHNASTRRQLLEYALAVPDHTLVLVDASAGLIHEVTFPRLAPVCEGQVG